MDPSQRKSTAGGGGGVVLGMPTAHGRQMASRAAGLGDRLPESALPPILPGLGQLSLSLEATASLRDQRLLPACMESRTHRG